MLTPSQRSLYHTIQNSQRERSKRIGNKGIHERLDALSQLKKMLTENEARWLHALKEDLGKPEVEAYASEVALLLNEIDYMSKHLAKWLKPTAKRRLLLTGIETTTISAYPYGSILVLAPWNYPLQLALMPVIGALAAGNGIVLKPSEHAPKTSKLLADLVPLYLVSDTLFVVEGDRDLAEALTQMEWDFIFFTGSPQTGRKVYQAAAANLTPVLMELGGKNPCILDETGLSSTAIKQIAWGKFLNAGQSCIAPDTVYVPRKNYREFLEKMKDQLRIFYGENPETSLDYGRISHTQHFKKLLHYLEDGSIYYGGDYSQEERFIAPTLLVEVKPGSPIVREEIFGPILPVIPYDSLDEVIEQLAKLPVPLAVYVFSTNQATVRKLEKELESGAFSVNQVMMHATNPFLPFGGKGKSGLGRYHGFASFQALSYQRGAYTKKSPLVFSKQFPPYSSKALGALRKLRRKIF